MGGNLKDYKVVMQIYERDGKIQKNIHTESLELNASSLRNITYIIHCFSSVFQLIKDLTI